MTDVLVLTDGVPGHDRASRGVLAALARHHRSLRPRWLGIAEVRPRSRRLARVAASVADPHRWLAANVRLAPERVGDAHRAAAAPDWPAQADIVVSTGPATAATNIAAARRYRARNVYCGFPKWPVRGFTLLLTPVPAHGPGIVVVPRPSEIDPGDLPPPRPLHAPGARRLALLFGGDTKHYRYTAADADTLARSLAGVLNARPDWSLLLCDSRRTTPAVFDALVAPLSDRAAVEVIRFRGGGLGSNRAAFSADLAMVTADSLSMITEAVTAARPTLVIRPAGYRGPRRDRAELAALLRDRLVDTASFDALSPEALAQAPHPPSISALDALSRILTQHGL